MKTNARIYLMKSEDGMLKLGHSKNPAKRAREIGPRIAVVHQTNVIEHAEKIERLAHRVLALHGRHVKDEWFEASLEDGIKAIEIATRQAESELPLGGRLRPVCTSVSIPIKLPLETVQRIDAILARQPYQNIPRTLVLQRAIIEWIKWAEENGR